MADILLLQNFSTVITESGQIFAQLAQAMHAVMSVTWAGW
jgi:hypothetical protein